jgi:predicted transposase YdaD
MTKTADISSKRLISLAPLNWVQWVTQFPNLQVRDIIDSDFQWISREGDVLVRVYSPQLGEFLVLNELQLRYRSEMPRRMRAYAALAEEKYQLPTYPVLINILQVSEQEIPTRYESSFAGLEARQDYRVINLWEVDVEIAFQQPVSSLLPFVPILKGGAEETTIQRALRILRTDENLSELESLMAFLASFVLESRVVQQIMRWDMAVLEQSPWYQQILQQGERRGEIRGILSSIEVALKIKFANDGLQLLPAISQILDVERLKAIQIALITGTTLDELRKLISNGD